MIYFTQNLSKESKSIINASPELKETVETCDKYLTSLRDNNTELELESEEMKIKGERLKNQLEYSKGIIFQLSLENRAFKEIADEYEVEISEEVNSRLFS